MTLDAFQEVLSRLVVEPTFRSRFLEDPEIAVVGYGLTALEKRRLRAIDPYRLGAFGRLIESDRTQLFIALLPSAAKACLSDEEIASLARTYAALFPNRGSFPWRENLARYLQWIERSPLVPRKSLALLCLAKLERMRLCLPVADPVRGSSSFEGGLRLAHHAALVHFPGDVFEAQSQYRQRRLPIGIGERSMVFLLRQLTDGLRLHPVDRSVVALIRAIRTEPTIERVLAEAHQHCANIDRDALAGTLAALIGDGTLEGAGPLRSVGLT